MYHWLSVGHVHSVRDLVRLSFLYITHASCQRIGCFYRLQRSWAKVMFLQASVILSTGGGSASVHAGIPHPPGSDTPQEQTPPPQSRSPLGADPPHRADTPQDQTPHGSRHPPDQTPLPQEADSGIRSTSGRHTSYWNAFLLLL